MGYKKSSKQLGNMSKARDLRWPSSVKENLLLPPASPPRTRKRANDYTSTLEHRIEAQDARISTLSAANARLSSNNTVLRTQIDQSNALISSLEESNTTTSNELATIKDDLESAHDLIAHQEHVIRQKNQRINRLIRDKAVLTAKLAVAKQETLDAVLRANAAEKLSKTDALRIEGMLQQISSFEHTLSRYRQNAKDQYNTLRATQKREKRAKTKAGLLKEEVLKRKKWKAKHGHAYNAQYRAIALAAKRAGCAQARIGPLLLRIGKMFGVQVHGSMSRRTVSRVCTEAGIRVELQIGHELARAKAVCLSSDGTSHRNVKYEARHLTYLAPTYTTDPNAPQTESRTRVVEVNHALDHTAQSQYEGWEIVNKKILDTYLSSPLPRRDAEEGLTLDSDDLWRKMVAYNADHAADVKSTARKCTEKKAAVAESDLEKAALIEMSTEEVEEALWDVVQEVSDDPDGLEAALPPALRAEAMQSLSAYLGSKALEDLPEHQQRHLTETIFAGCCSHKGHNCALGGVTGMEAAWAILKLTPPGFAGE
ncbi:hypothetical protein C8R46DRAFT_1209230 [Mycena filopes]|nr:hypothetical protein C8R46DRAFT_1209230 [Mycena filopes]